MGKSESGETGTKEAIRKSLEEHRGEGGRREAEHRAGENKGRRRRRRRMDSILWVKQWWLFRSVEPSS